MPSHSCACPRAPVHALSDPGFQHTPYALTSTSPLAYTPQGQGVRTQGGELSDAFTSRVPLSAPQSSSPQHRRNCPGQGHRRPRVNSRGHFSVLLPVSAVSDPASLHSSWASCPHMAWGRHTSPLPSHLSGPPGLPCCPSLALGWALRPLPFPTSTPPSRPPPLSRPKLHLYPDDAHSPVSSPSSP